MDSFGALYSEQIRDLIAELPEGLEGTGKHVGIHAHNNQQLAYANTIEALIVGANRLDATINGLGRGAGNCPLELLLGFLKNPKFHLRPVLECIQKHFLPCATRWTGAIDPLHDHRPAQPAPPRGHRHARRRGPDDYVAFYDEMIEEE